MSYDNSPEKLSWERIIIAYDTQQIKALYAHSAHDAEALKKHSALAAFRMYIGFVAIFINILQLLGIFNQE